MSVAEYENEKIQTIIDEVEEVLSFVNSEDLIVGHINYEWGVDDRYIISTDTFGVIEHNLESIKTKLEMSREDLFQKFVESLDLEDEEDYFLHERLMQFKKSEASNG